MECGKVKELLSEYAGGTLEGREKETVEEHLSVCKGCSEEFESLKAYFAALGSLEEVEPPEDFIRSVHQRIRRKRGFRQVLRKIFVPAGIKVPLEVAGLAATAVLIIYVSNNMQSVEKDMFVPEAEVSKAAGKSAKEVPVTREMDYLQEAADEEVAYFRKPVLVITRLPAETLERRENKPVSSMALEVKKAGERGKDRNVPVDKSEAEEFRREKLGVAEPELSGAEHEMLTGVNELVVLAAGKVLYIEYADGSVPQFIVAEIPAENYDVFLEKLEQIADIEIPLSSVPEEGEEPVKLQIKFVKG